MKQLYTVRVGLPFSCSGGPNRPTEFAQIIVSFDILDGHSGRWKCGLISCVVCGMCRRLPFVLI